jgi:CubicO group peptidase (beta-lactamase class C family)
MSLPLLNFRELSYRFPFQVGEYSFLCYIKPKYCCLFKHWRCDVKQDGETLKLLKHFESLGIPGFDCIVLRRGKCIFRFKSGFSDVEKSRPVTGNERYNIYSCSKLITCTAALMLVEKDIIRLDDAVHEYLPEFKHMKKMADGVIENVKNTMTLRHLFTMTAGLTYNVDSENIKRGIAETNGTMQTREAMKYLACDPLAFEPGSSWLYSLSHDVLAAIVEVVSGKQFGEFVKENIFDVAGMKRSTFCFPMKNFLKLLHNTITIPKAVSILPAQKECRLQSSVQNTKAAEAVVFQRLMITSLFLKRCANSVCSNLKRLQE